MTDKKKQLDITTQLVHAGERGAAPNGRPVATPVYTTATYTYETMAEMDQVFAGEKPGFVYSRYGNPTNAGFEAAMTTLEAGAGACAYASGMGALHAAIFACQLEPGDTLLASGSLRRDDRSPLQSFRILWHKTVSADFNDLAGVAAKARETKPRLLIAETISNPLLKVCDIDAYAALAREVRARLLIDNTFASPYLCRPLLHGADVVIHSATKYLSGHADTMGGVVITKEPADMMALVGTMKIVGSILGAWEAHEIMRGIKTLALRMERQCANAEQLANHLAQHPGVKRVYYPNLGSPETKETLGRILRAPYSGALVAIELSDDSREGAFRFMDALQMCVRATSLGDVFTEVLHPATASHREVAPARRRQLGISDGLVRISVGIEALSDLIDDATRRWQ